jgi:hypothetical protein
MNTYQITRALKHDPVTSKQFCGVFPSDKSPRTIEKYPCGFVANTDPSSESGTHWIAFYFPSEEKGEFFDSYGHAPEYYRKSFGNFLKTHTWDFNKRKLQSAWSDVCGQYCIFYLSHRARGFSLSRIVHLFNSDTISNDAKVSQFVKRHFKVMPKRSSVNNQSSKKMFLIKIL